MPVGVLKLETTLKAPPFPHQSFHEAARSLLSHAYWRLTVQCNPNYDVTNNQFTILMQYHNLKASDAEDFKPRMAALTPGMSGAQIANVCNEAALYAARNGKDSVTLSDFDHAVDRVIAGAEKKSKVLGEAERRIVAYHESGHVLTAWFLKHADPLLKTTIIPRTSGALGFAQYVPSDKYLHSREELEDRLVVMLGKKHCLAGFWY